MKDEYVSDFVKKLGISKKVIATPIKKRQWKKLVHNMIIHVPRKDGRNRYGM